MNRRARMLSRTMRERAERNAEASFDSQIPVGVRVAAAWSWRALVIAAAAGLMVYALFKLSVVVVPALIAILVTALTIPLVNFLARIGLPRFPAAGLGLLLVVIVIGGLLTLVGQQIASGFTDLTEQVFEGIQQVRQWLVEGPLQLSDRDINMFMDRAVEQAREFVETGGSQITAGVLNVASTVSNVIAGFLLVLFASLFFLYEGDRIWGWCVNLFPRQARRRVDDAGRSGWQTLTAFVRATVLVALVDAIGIGLVAYLLSVPFWFPIAVLVFLGAFVPILGALISGVVAILVALVVHGPLVALLMTGGVLLVQQIESNVLQPILMGRMVKVHPLAVILAVGAGVYLAGIAGAFFAVPVVAVLNSVVSRLVRPPGEQTPEEPPEPNRLQLWFRRMGARVRNAVAG